MKADDNGPMTPDRFVLQRQKRLRSTQIRDETKFFKHFLRKSMTARELIEAMMKEEISLGAIAKASGISATTLRLHVHRGQPMSPKNAKIFAQWSGGQVSAVKMFVEGEVA